MKPLVSLGSLDLFWLPRVQQALEPVANTKLFSTWSLKRPAPNPTLQTYNNFLLHYLLQITKMYPAVNFHNRSYSVLCAAFDRWFTQQLDCRSSVVTFLSGVGLHAGRKARSWGCPTVVECGSTHTDYQHEIISEEYARNGLGYSLFPESYRDRVRQEFVEADFIQIPSTFVKKTFIERGFPDEKLLVAPYGVDLNIFEPRLRPPADAPFRAICPSGVNLRKGARILVEAWRKLNWKNAELRWMGAVGPQTRHLFSDHPSTLMFEHWRPHTALAELYRSCDVLVLPSFEEGFARVLVEGAASGIPLIVTPNTGVEDFFTPGSPEGWLTPCNDVDALCQALTEAKNDRERTYALGQRAAERARAFSWEAYGEKVRANYETILKR